MGQNIVGLEVVNIDRNGDYVSDITFSGEITVSGTYELGESGDDYGNSFMFSLDEAGAQYLVGVSKRTDTKTAVGGGEPLDMPTDAARKLLNSLPEESIGRVYIPSTSPCTAVVSFYNSTESAGHISVVRPEDKAKYPDVNSSAGVYIAQAVANNYNGVEYGFSSSKREDTEKF